MIRRTTIEIDQELLQRAKRVAGFKTTRATVEEALRRMAADQQAEVDDRSARQEEYLANLASRVEIEVLLSEAMWR